MKLYPHPEAKILVENDYIMASLGVLSKAHEGAALKLLAKSLRIKLPKKRRKEEDVSEAGN